MANNKVKKISTPKVTNPEETITEYYVKKGFSALAISALVGWEVKKVQAFIDEKGLEAQRALFLEQHPNISAMLASQFQLGKILKKQQEGIELSSAELAHLTKLVDQQREDQDRSEENYMQLSKEELDRKIFEMWKKAYAKRKFRYFPRPKLRARNEKIREQRAKEEQGGGAGS